MPAIQPARPLADRVAAWWSIGRFHIVAIAALAALTFGWAFTGERLWFAVAMCAIDWFVVNLLNRVVDLVEDRANGIAGTEVVDRHARWLSSGAALLLLGSAVATAFVAPWLLVWRAGYHTLGAVYNWPLVGRRLKERYGVKNPASATGFIITVFGYPLTVAAALGVPWLADVTWIGIALVAVWFFLFELSFEVIYDLRDIEGDRLAGVDTWPAVKGHAWAVRLIAWLLGTSTLVLAVGWVAGFVPWRLVVMGIAPALQWWLLQGWLKRGVSSRDCLRATWVGAALLAAYQVWIVLELPGVS